MENSQSKATQKSGRSFLLSHLLQEVHHFHYLSVESLGLGALLAAIGGFLDAYTYISRNGVFATAQTGNLVLLGLELAQRQWSQGLLHIPPIVAFVAGVAVSVVFKHPRITQFFPHPVRTVLIVEMVVLTIIGFLPAAVPNMFITIAIAFVASVQISSFRKLIKWPYNSAMVTGNLRTAVEAGYTAVFTHDQQAAKQALNFFCIIFSFFVGAVIGTLTTLHIGIRAIWIASGILLFAMLIVKQNPEKVS